ncbi:hypothetical protein CDFC105_64227 [Clostridioides difficile]|nr:hypothetical protein CDFC105_64227 [Clostridioides difficile]
MYKRQPKTFPRSYIDSSTAAALPAFDVGVSNIIRADATASEAIPAPTKINAKAIVEYDNG